MRLIDLFSGCGGFSLGACQAGYSIAAAFDNDLDLTSSYKINFPETGMIYADIEKLTGDDIRVAVKGSVEGIIGGPPCQGFSDIGRRDPLDPRRTLLADYFRIVREIGPKFFVMENVRGLAYWNAYHVLEEALELVTKEYSILGPIIWNAADFGAATTRSRLFVVGIHKDFGHALGTDDMDTMRRQAADVRSAIGDLEGAVPIGDRDGFDTWRITKVGRPFNYARSLRSPDGQFTGHRVTNHSERVRARFEGIPEGGIDPIGRHPRLFWKGQCPTLRAGTGSDRGSHQALRPIHPEEPRVITVREAARLQGFPDTHKFHSTIWHSFRMIGNSVSPIMAHAILTAIRSKLANA